MITITHDPVLNASNEELQRELADMKRQLAEATQQLAEANQKLQEREVEQKPKVEGDEKSEFEGFDRPISNYFRMPNNWTDISAKIKTRAELLVIEYVLRHTWGFQEYEGELKKITIDEFMHGRKRKGGGRLDRGTGLSKQSVVDGTKNAIEHGYLICEVDDSDKARIEKSYALNMKAFNPDMKNPDAINGCQESRHQQSKILTSNVENLDSSGLDSRQRSEKETPERNSRKKLGKKESASIEPTSSSANGALPSSQSFSSNAPSEVRFSLEEQRIYDLWCQMPFNVTPPKITQTLKERCAQIAPHIHTLEEMKSLEAFTRQHRKLGSRTIALGNLYNCLNEWKQAQLPPADQEEAKSPRQPLNGLRDLRTLNHGGK